MKVLFLESHPMWIHGLPNGFRDAGHQVVVSGPLTEENIPKLIAEFNPDLIVSLGWTPEHEQVKLQWIRKYVKETKIPLIYWATEDPAFTECFTLPLIKTILPDFVFTICAEKVDFYRQLGISAAHLPFAFHHSVHHRTAIDNNYKTSIAVVANAYPDYIWDHPECVRLNSLKILINPLLKQNIRIDFWGKDWERMNPFVEYNIPGEWIHGYLPYTEANKVYSSADIVIGLQNSQLTQRTYEILGSEGFLLTNDTMPVTNILKNGRDLITSSSPEETVELVSYYLKHPEEREIIRKQGNLTISPHNYTNRAEYIIKTLKGNNLLPNDIT